MNVLDPHSLLAAFGAAGVFLILFAETGLLIGFFLPGDSLLFTAGLLSATPVTAAVHLSLPVVLLAAAAGALLGAQVVSSSVAVLGRHCWTDRTGRGCSRLWCEPASPSSGMAPARPSCWHASSPWCALW